MTACKKDEVQEEKAKIEIPSEQLDQTAYADEENTGNGFTLTARGSWVATVVETTNNPTASVPEALALTGGNETTWVKLLCNGIETYSGNAGDFQFTVQLVPNYTGLTRSAQIGITSGKDVIKINVTQQGVTRQGSVPTDPNAVPLKLVSVLTVAQTASEAFGGNQQSVFSLTYDDQNRIIRFKETQEGFVEYEFLYTGNKVEVKSNFGGEIQTCTVTFDGNGYLSTLEDTFATDKFYYSDGCLSRAAINMIEPAEISYDWADENIIQIRGPRIHKYPSVERYEYTQYLNDKVNLDLNGFFLPVYETCFQDNSLFAILGWLGKRSKNYLAGDYGMHSVSDDHCTTELNDTQAQYAFDEHGYVTRMTVSTNLAIYKTDWESDNKAFVRNETIINTVTLVHIDR